MQVWLDKHVLETLNDLKNTYGYDIFSNVSRVNYILCDLIPRYKRERLQIRNFLEMGGFSELLAAERDFEPVRRNMERLYQETYLVPMEVAAWVSGIFCVLLGYAETIESVTTNELSVFPEQGITLQKRNRLIHTRRLDTSQPLGKSFWSAYGYANENEQFGDWLFTVRVRGGVYYIIGKKTDGTVLKSKIDQSMLAQLYQWKALLLYQNRLTALLVS